MTQKDKELLLRELCARYPYGVIVNIIDHNDKTYNKDGELHEIKFAEADCEGLMYLFHVYGCSCLVDITEIKPYLRPMSNMTEEEKQELSHLLPKDWSVDIDKLNNLYFNMCSSIFIEIDILLHIIDWLNKHHFDYHGLIEEGLALEAPEGMYK